MEVMFHIAVTEVLLMKMSCQIHATGTLQLGKRSPVPGVLDVG
jgi:hypothetical protein